MGLNNRVPSTKRGNAARLFGYDIFISFALGPLPRGTQSYASDLARRLRERDFTVFFSEDEAPPGERLDSSLRSALHRSKTLVVIANRGTLDDPRWVRTEVEEFRKRHPQRPIVSISVDGALRDASLASHVREWLAFDDKIWLDESQDAVVSGIASEDVVTRLATAPTRVRSNVNWRRVVRASIGTLVLLVIALGIAAKIANDSAARARSELRRALSLVLAAQAPTLLSGVRTGGDERAILELVAAHRIAPGPEVEAALLDGLLARRSLIKLISTAAPVTAVAFSPDGTRIASGNRDSHFAGISLGTGYHVRLWEASTGRPIGSPLDGHTDDIEAVAFSPDGTRLISASGDKTLRVWDVSSGRLHGVPLAGHTSAAFSPDGTRIISVADDDMLRLWDVQTQKQLKELSQGHKTGVDAVTFSRDGSRIVSGGFDPSVRVWNAKTGEQVGAGEAGAVQSVSVSPDGQHIVSGGRSLLKAQGDKDDELYLWEGVTGTLVRRELKGHQHVVNSVAWSGDGTRVASGSSDSTIRLWDPVTAQPAGPPLEGHRDSVNSVAFGHDGARLVSGGEDGTIRVWDVKAEASLGTPLPGKADGVSSVAISPDGSRIVSGERNGSVRFWDRDTGTPIGEPRAGHTSSVNALSFNPDGTRLVSASNDGMLRMWNTQSATPVGSPLEGHLGPVLCVAWSPDGRRIASGGHAWQNRQSVDHVVRLWDSDTGQLVATLEGHTGAIKSLAFSPDGRVLSGSADGTLRWWDVKTGRPDGAPIKADTTPVSSVAVSPDGSRIASASRWTVRTWDASTGRPTGAPFEGHSSAVAVVAFSPDGRRIVSGSWDHTLRVWDAQTGQSIGVPLQGHRGDVRSIAFSRDGRLIVSGSDDGDVRLWPAPNAWADLLGAKVTRNMSRDEWREWVSGEIDYIVQCPGLPVPPDASPASSPPPKR